jgi:hypothetical protein
MSKEFKYQLCVKCGERTGRCSEDALYVEITTQQGVDVIEPLCEECYDKAINKTS